MKAADRRELVGYLRQYEGLSKAQALQELVHCTEASLKQSLLNYRKRTVSSRERVTPLPAMPVIAAEHPGSVPKAKKVPYTLLLQPEQLDALRMLAEEEGSSVSHHIRQAIRAYLRGYKL